MVITVNDFLISQYAYSFYKWLQGKGLVTCVQSNSERMAAWGAGGDRELVARTKCYVVHVSCHDTGEVKCCTEILQSHYDVCDR